MAFEVRTEIAGLEPEAKRAIVEIQTAVKREFAAQELAAKHPKRRVTELHEDNVIAAPGEVVRVKPGADDITVYMPEPDPANAGEDIVISFEGDGTAAGHVLIEPLNGTCLVPGIETLYNPGTYRFTSTGARNESANAAGGAWSGPAEMALEELPDIAPQRLLGNPTGASAAPTEITASEVLDWVDNTRGTIPFRGAAAWQGLDPGVIELPIVSKGAGANPVYQQLATAGIADDAVTNAKLANMAQSTLKLRASGAGPGDPTDGTITQALDMAGSTRGSLPLRGAASWAVLVPAATDLPLVSNGVGADPSYRQLPAASLVDDTVTNAKLANMAPNTIKANPTAGTADPQDLAIAADSLPARVGGNLVTHPFATLAGGGITYAAGVLAVGAGVGVTVNANDIAVSATWAQVLANNNNTGAVNPNIDTGQYVGFGTEGSYGLFGDIRASGALNVGAVGSIVLSAGDDAVLEAGNAFGDLATVKGESVLLQPTSVAGSLRVGNHVLMTESSGASGPGTVISAAEGMWWVDNTTPSGPMFRDDTNVNHALAYIATAAEVTTGTDTLSAVTPATQQFHSSACKFWVVATGGTAAIDDSYNVQSTTDTGVGQMTVTIQADFTSANWCCQVSTEMVDSSPDTAAEQMIAAIEGTRAAGAVTVSCTEPISAWPNRDPFKWHVMGFGDF